MGLKVIFFDSKEGDSCLIEYSDNQKKHYGVIDCNAYKKDSDFFNPVYSFLVNNNIKNLSFLAITHFHGDHFFTIEKILDHCDSINEIYLSPSIYYYISFIKSGSENGKKILESICKFIRRTKTGSVPYGVGNSIKHLFKYLKEPPRGTNIILPTGFLSELRPVGFGDDIKFYAVQPPAKLNSKLISFSDEFLPENQIQTYSANNFSLAFKIEYEGFQFLLGGDATASVWDERKKRFSTDLNPNVIKIPHHGSKKDNPPKILAYLFGSNGQNVIISASGGKKHPHKDTLTNVSLGNRNVFCTNKSVHCPFLNDNNSFNSKTLKQLSSTDKTILSSLDFFSNEISSCCKNIIVEVINKKLEINPKSPCSILRDFVFLAGDTNSNN